MSEGIEIDTLDGECPVLGKGRIDGQPFLFRSRGGQWSIGIGGDPVSKPHWYHEAPYRPDLARDERTSLDKAKKIISGAADFYRATKRDAGVAQG